MSELLDGVNASVGSARAAEFDFAGKQLVSRLLQFALNRVGVVLNLPAAIARAFVFDFEFPGVHIS